MLRNICLSIISVIVFLGYSSFCSGSDSFQSVTKYTLEQLYETAISKSENIELSSLNLKLSEIEKQKALAVLVPSVSSYWSLYSLNDDYKELKSLFDDPVNVTKWGVLLDQSFTLNGRELIAFKATKEMISQSRYDLYAAKEELLFNVASLYYEVLKAEKAIQINEANVKRLQEHRKLVSARLALGDITKTDIIRTDADISSARTDLISSKNALDLAKASLASLACIPKEIDWDVADPSYDDPFFKDDLKSSLSMAISERAELKSLESQKKIADAYIKYERGGHWPKIALQVGYIKEDHNKETTSGVIYPNEDFYGMITVSLPIFQGGLVNAMVKGRAAQRDIAVVSIQQKIKQILIEVEQAYLNLKSSQSMVGSLRDQLKYARQNFDAVESQFENGLANSVDVMEASALLTTSEGRLSDAIYSNRLALLALKKAEGTFLKSVLKK